VACGLDLCKRKESGQQKQEQKSEAERERERLQVVGLPLEGMVVTRAFGRVRNRSGCVCVARTKDGKVPLITKNFRICWEIVLHCRTTHPLPAAKRLRCFLAADEVLVSTTFRQSIEK
jgi:hypothetical protein